jgi:hypothetical protein
MQTNLKIAFSLIIITFLFLFFATFVTVRVAMSSPTHLIDKNYYEIGLEYEKFVNSESLKHNKESNEEAKENASSEKK